jgi:hypothetical protein
MDKKVDENVRDRIMAILNLVSQFKKMYSKGKNNSETEQGKKRRAVLTQSKRSRGESDNKDLATSNQCGDG